MAAQNILAATSIIGKSAGFDLDTTTTTTLLTCASEKVYKIKKGKKITQEKNYFPGYMLLEINEKMLNKDIVQTINQMTNVISFLSDKDKKPIPIRPAEANRILGKVDEMQDADESINEPFIVFYRVDFLIWIYFLKVFLKRFNILDSC